MTTDDLCPTPDGRLTASAATVFERSRRHWFRYLALPAGQDAAELALARAALAELLRQLAGDSVTDLRALGLRDVEDAGWFTALGAEAMVEHEARPSTQMITLAVAAFTQAVELTPDTADERAAAWSNLGIALRTRYHASGDRCCLGQAVAAHRNAIAATSVGHSGRSTRMLALAMTLLARFEELGDAADLDQAAALAEGGVAELRPGVQRVRMPCRTCPRCSTGGLSGAACGLTWMRPSGPRAPPSSRPRPTS